VSAPVVGLADSHAHVSLPGAFDADRAQVLARARAAGVARILDLATRIEDAEATIALAAAHPGVLAAVGVHPHEAAGWDDASAARLRGAAASGRLAAIGEIGLDYHYNLSAPAAQRRALAEQLRVAAEFDLPVSVHSREAEADTLALLRDSEVGRHGGVLHCFTGSEPFARGCLELGLLLSFSGIVTFANAARLREIARAVPDDRLLVETDSPYLAPVPYRGQRNEPARVVDVARRVAELRGVPEAALVAATTANFERLFRVAV
jgi:TatD DNase family protein